jgi:hypothetical protein
MERSQTLGALVGLSGGTALNQTSVSAQSADHARLRFTMGVAVGSSSRTDRNTSRYGWRARMDRRRLISAIDRSRCVGGTAGHLAHVDVPVAEIRGALRT